MGKNQLRKGGEEKGKRTAARGEISGALSQWRKNMLRSGNRYQVHDGAGRIGFEPKNQTTLSLKRGCDCPEGFKSPLENLGGKNAGMMRGRCIRTLN